MSAEITNLLILKYINHLPLWQEICTLCPMVNCSVPNDRREVYNSIVVERTNHNFHLGVEDKLDLR